MMMQMTIEMDHSLELVTVDSLSTCFPKTERFLSNCDNQNALSHLARRKNTDRYRSIMDFFACETLTMLRPACMRFYATGNGMLNEYFPAEALDQMDKMLLIAAKMAKLSFDSQRKLSWASFKRALKTDFTNRPDAIRGPIPNPTLLMVA